MATIRYLTVAEVISINIYLINKYSNKETAMVKDVKLLDSAVNRPRQSAFGEEAYVTVIDKASALFHSLALNHAFHNANKRTAFTSMIQFLRYNGYAFIMEQKAAEDFVVDVVNHKYGFNQIVTIVNRYSAKI